MTNNSRLLTASLLLLGALPLLGNSCEDDDQGTQEQTGSTDMQPGKGDYPGQTPVCGTRGGVQCDKGEFCNFEPDSDCGATDRGGVCEEIPTICTREFRPVCGCDGNTYGNVCSAHASGVSIAADGACGAPTACGTRGGVECAEGEFCNFPSTSECGANDGGGACEALPQFCTEEYAPVCGCDRRTYGNECAAHAAGVSVLHRGECTEIDCAAIGGRAVDGIGPGPMCDEGEALHSYIVYSSGAMSIEGTACCVPTSLSWFKSCGDPVCRGDNGLTPACTSQVAGEACSPDSPDCALNDGCNARLTCTDTDPTTSGCPRSRAEYKQNISYLDDAELAQYHEQVLDLKLAHYAYKEDPKREQHLGFIIEDVEPATYVEEARNRVDLYAYTSAVIAAVKVQEKRIHQLEREVRGLTKALAKAKAGQRASQAD